MKSRNRRNQGIAAIGAWWSANVVVLAKAFHYGCAAECDERKGFPHTAAMEWRNAAELLATNTRAAEYCWRQWERIMDLPRRLAVPVVDSQQAGFSLPPASAFRPVMAPALNQVSFVNAA
jgi:hypothetical protein